MDIDNKAGGTASNLLASLLDGDGVPPHEGTKLADINVVTQKIIGCAYMVSNALGCGFLEKVYENALAHELRKAGLKALQQHPIKVYYDDIVVGKYVADLLVEDCVIVEVKALKGLAESHLAQCLNYLKAIKIKIGLLINFGRAKVEVRRVAL